MQLCRFGDRRLGVVEDATVCDVTEALDILPSFSYPLPDFDVFIANLDRVRERIEATVSDAPRKPLDEVTLLSPVANPSKAIGAPLNYQKHMDEVGQDPALHHNNQVIAIHRAGLFLKARSALAGPGEGIAVRKLDRRTDHEVELALVIGKEANNVTADKALDYVAGYGIGLDITMRGPEERCLRKSVDSYAVLGPWLVTADEIAEPNNLDLRIEVNGEIRQSSNTKNMILSVPKLIEYASSFYTLNPGDVIFTGTPEGVGPIRPGDVLLASVEKIGTMEVKVRAA